MQNPGISNLNEFWTKYGIAALACESLLFAAMWITRMARSAHIGFSMKALFVAGAVAIFMWLVWALHRVSRRQLAFCNLAGWALWTLAMYYTPIRAFHS